MATTKTLTPTNQAITLAAFTEKPDNRTNVTNDDKLADAVNALNSNLTTVTNISSSVSGLHEGVNAVRIDANTVVGNYTFSENMRGYATKNGTVVVGLVSTWDLAHNVFVSANNSSQLTTAFDINSNMTVVTAEAASEHTYQNRKVVFTKAGHAAMFRLDGLVNIATASNTICSVPTGFAPAGTFATDMWIGTNNAKLRFSLNANEVVVYNYASGTISESNINIVIQYICA